MTFTSNLFLIGLFPWLALLVFLTRKRKNSRKILILLANTVFYIWGGIGAFVFLCLFSIVLWLFTVIVNRSKNKFLFAVMIGITLIPLFATKYTGFVVGNINSFVGCKLNIPDISVPIGISFFTFEAISLLCDLYAGKIQAKISCLDVYLYLSFFPTVTSGPIIRFQDFKNGLCNRIHNIDYGYAVERIIIGLCKKVLVADKIAVLADYYFDGAALGNVYSCLGLWIGSITYTLQLYFDFSGYSDMAIGIGQLLGFNISENFNKPYQAGSISDFWKRWHISLSRWFKDYVYIPLGGNRCAVPKHILNLFIVWVLTGIWHGADWSFLLWGLGYFVLLVLEKYVPAMKNIGTHWYGHVYALFFINILWIPFRADNLSAAVRFIAGMFGANGIGTLEEKAIAFIPYLIAALLLCLPWNLLLEKHNKEYRILKGIILVLLTGLAVCAVINASYMPYIYGNF